MSESQMLYSLYEYDGEPNFYISDATATDVLKLWNKLEYRYLQAYKYPETKDLVLVQKELITKEQLETDALKELGLESVAKSITTLNWEPLEINYDVSSDPDVVKIYFRQCACQEHEWFKRGLILKIPYERILNQMAVVPKGCTYPVIEL